MNHHEQIEKLAALMNDIQLAMLTTIEPDGTLRLRPMTTQQVEFDGDLWFFTQESAPKVDEVERDDRVNVAYAAPDANRWVSVFGTAQVVHDRAKAEALWQPLLKAWFPQGLDDLLKVTVEQAEYWDTSSSKMVQLAGFVEAIATGKAYEPGDNEKLSLSTA